MKKILQNSWLFIFFILAFLFKENIYKLFNPAEYNFNYIKENELNYYKEEYQKLLNIYNLDVLEEKEYILSKIIYRDVYDFYHKMVIAKGSKDDIKEGSVVVSTEGLVGIINKVNKNSSDVLILYNSDLKLSVKINDTYGILESDNNTLYIKNIVSDATINVGDIIYTSGLTKIEGDIPIATVKKISISKDKLSQIIEAKEIVNLKDIDYIMIINEEKSSDE
jgi:rod shape-determining protein MreC